MMWRDPFMSVLFLLLPILPAITLPGFMVNTFIAPRPIAAGIGEDEEGSSTTDGEDAPTENAPPEAASPLACLGSRPSQLHAFGSVCRMLAARDTLAWQSGSSGMQLRDPSRFRGRLGRLVAGGCCLATSMKVDAPPIQPHAPPGAAERYE